ncbi:MAG: penicillin-binding protein [Clostridiales bacterium]|jgi:penicillin-binding protein 1A|nr:penicillin-binding protein [Clostridiales bacterium]MDN5282320.1 penicillin-binding protein [Candidatus Ozemobacter sp.]
MIFSKGQDPEDNFDPAQDEEAEESETVTQKVLSWLWFFFKLGFVVGIVSIIVVTGAILGVLKGFSERIPIIADNSYRPNLTSQVFDCNGKILAKLHAEENRTVILSSKEIPEKMKHAVVAIEDERFYQHYGIDLIGIARAMIKNVKAGRVVQGASTLTQQLVKNAFLTSERTFKRKAIEAMMAFQLERKYSKEEILTLYLNEIYFGHGAYGLAAAAELYFDKKPMDLTIAECAMLAGIPKSPVAFSPYRNAENNKARRDLVLAKMVELGFITPAQYEAAKKETPRLTEMKNQEQKAPYFVTYVRDQLLEKYGANLVYNGGLKVYTTIDLDFQDYAESAMASAPIFAEYPIDKHPGLNGSLVCLDPKNGHIKAMYGGRSFEQSQFNRVTQAYRQPGSSFKPFVYACALEEGMLPSDTILDEHISYTNPWTKKVWTPRNYDLKFHGTVTLIKGLCKSYNVPAVKLIDKLTPAKVIRFAKRLGVTAQMEPNLSLALGSGQFTPLEMASAYGVFANMGIYCRPLSILKVVDRDGNILEENLPRAKEVMKAKNAAMICDMLKTAVERGTGARARIKGYTVGGKTGTTNDYVDAWFNGISPDLVTVVQFGFDMPKTLGPRKAGGSVAGPVWKAFMEKALTHFPKKDFPIPEGTVRARVCMTSGKLASKACPAREVVYQVFPIESQPLTECRHWVVASQYAPVTEVDDEVMMPASYTNMPDPDFFRGNYQSTAMQNSTGLTPSSPAVPAVPQNGWISRDKPNNNILKKWGADQTIPRDAFLDEGMADVPAVEPDEYKPREPGVIIQPPPKVEFRDSYH